MTIDRTVAAVTDRIRRRSAADRSAYLERAREGAPPAARCARRWAARTSPTALRPRRPATRSCCARRAGPTSPSSRPTTTCCRRTSRSSASRELIKQAAREAGGTAQFAGGMPAMCDGVTQGEPGMELSLFSRDVIAMATAVALSHNMFDAALCLGICDKIVPGLLIGALQFGHLPAIFVPGGPMPSGMSNDEKAQRAPALCQGQGRPRRAAGIGGEVVPRPRHLHLLRHRQQQPDADGSDGPAPAGRGVRQPEHAAARCADGGGRAQRAIADQRRSAASTCRSATSSTSARSSTPSSGCSPPAARPTTPSTWSRSRARPAS